MKRLLSISFFLCLTVLSMAQTRRVYGSVVSAEDDSPIAGAFVSVVNNSKDAKTYATSTDISGHFSLEAVPGSLKELQVSFLGMKNLVVPITDNMIIRMQADNQLLDEVMVVAYESVKKSSYTGSATMVKSKQLEDLPNASFENSINGRVAGVTVTSGTGQVGSAPSIRIRGNGSMNATNEPLYVIDGVPVMSGDAGQMSSRLYTTNNIMSTLNPDDIESVSVLKDAAASSLYGSRAANGVVVITTKKGKLGRPVVSFKASVGITPAWATDNYEPAGIQDQVDMLYSIFFDSYSSGGSDDAKATASALKKLNSKFNKHGYQFKTDGTGKYQHVNILEYDGSGREGKYFDWDDAYFRTAVYQNYDISVSGASDKTNYYTSFSYTKDEGRLMVNEFDRYSGRINLTQKVNKVLEVGTNVSLSRTSKSGYNDSRDTSHNLFFQTRNLLWGMYWPTDYKTGAEWTARYGSLARNSLYFNHEWENSSINTKISAVETVSLHLAQGLDLRSIFSYDNTTTKDHLYFSANHFVGSTSNGEINEMRTIYEKLVSSTTANYNRKFGQHSIGLLAGFEAEKNTTDFTRATGTNLPTSTLHTVATAGTLSANGYNWGNSMESLLSKADYNYAEKYFASASFRRDGSSKLSSDTRWGNFWSVAGAWRIKSEEFLKQYDYLSELRLRASYGINGTLPSNNYGFMNLMTYGNKYLGLPGGIITTLANQNLSWETSHSTNIGLDFGFFDQRLTGTVEFFNRNSKDLLQNVPISTTTGFSTILANIGEINNHGLEMQVGGDIIRKNNLTWSASANATLLKSSVTKLYDGNDILWYDPTGDNGRAQFIYREGESTRAFYGYEWAGVDKSNGKSVYYVNDPDDDSKGDFSYNGRGATYNFKNANYTVIGNAIPKVSGGISSDLAYGNFDASVNFIYKIGGDLYDAAERDVCDDGYYWERIRSQYYFEHTWRPDRTDGTQPELRGTDLEDAMQYSSRHIYDASFIRLKSITIGYRLPKNMVSKVNLSNVRFYFTGENLLTCSKYKMADPEIGEYGTRGWETPIGKTYTFGIDVKF